MTTGMTMGSVDSDSYFASLNPMANRLVQNKGKNDNSKYGSMCYEQQRWAENGYLYDSDSGEESDDSLPSLRVHGGERVVIDFDNNGWSWRDEHSAPFSWMTRSQEDLTIEEIFSDKEPPKSPKLPKVPSKIREGTAGKGGSNLIWNSPFVAADRGEKDIKFKHAEDDVFAKYGVSLGAFGEEKSFNFDDPEAQEKPVKTKRASLADILQLGPEGIRQIRESRRPERTTDSQYTSSSSLYSSNKELHLSSLSGSVSEISYESKPSSPDSTPTKPKKTKKKWWSPKKEKAAAKSALLGVNVETINNISATLPADLGQLSPVYVQDPGESCDHDDQSLASEAITITSTDSAVLPDESSFRSSDISSFTGTFTTDEGIVNPALSTTLEEGDDLLSWETRTLTEEDQVAASSNDPAPKSGFDFLDNW